MKDPSSKYSELIKEISFLKERIKELEQSAPDLKRVEEELGIHQIELEMQNEELRRTKEELEDSWSRYFDLYDLAPVGYVTLSEKGLILEANLTAATLLGVARGALSNQPLSRFILKDDQDVYYLHRNQLFETGNSQMCEMRMVRKDCSPFWVYLKTTIVQGGPGEPVYRVVLSDVTERKRMEAELLQAQNLESLGILAGGIAHDFNNLMTVILGNIELAMMRLPANHDSRSYLKTALQSAEQTKDLTGRFITFSRGGFSVKHMSDILGILREVVQKAVRDTTVRVTFDIEKDLWPVEADETLIRQVFSNLTVNAVEAMSDGGTLTIEAENIEVDNTNSLPLREGSYLRIIFADDGTGISEKDLSSIFDPYYTTKGMGAQKGLGLGLSVCYSVLKKHDGHIAVTSQPGKGATFTLYFPTLVEKLQETVQSLPSSHHRVLVMEDNANVRKLERSFLTQLGYEVIETKDGWEAIDRYKEALLSKNPFDLVILDLVVHQGLGGQITMEKLLKEDPSVRAIIASGHVDDPVIEYYRDHGFRGALKKPFRFQEFEKMVKMVIDTEA